MIAFDAISDGGGVQPGNSPLQWNHTCTGSDRLLLVVVKEGGTVAVTYNGVALTRLAAGADPNYGTVAIWGLLNPASGENQISVTWTGEQYTQASAASYTGVKQSDLPDDIDNVNGAPNVTSITADLDLVEKGWIFAATICGGGITISAGAGQTLRGGNSVNAQWKFGDSNELLDPGAQSITTNFSVSSATASIAAISFADVNQASYTRGDEISLPSNDTDLETEYDMNDIGNVETADNVRVAQTGTNQYMIHQFKNDIGGASACNVTWEGQTTWPPSSNPVTLQIYNRNTTSWETIDSDNTTAEDTDFQLTANIPDTTDYVDGNGFISCRIYQQATF